MTTDQTHETDTDDRARVTRRLAAAQQSAGLDALVEVVMSETETLRAENERLRRNTAGLYGRAHAAEARLDVVRAGVLRLADRYARDADTHLRGMAAKIARECSLELRDIARALDSDATASGQPTSKAHHCDNCLGHGPESCAARRQGVDRTDEGDER